MRALSIIKPVIKQLSTIHPESLRSGTINRSINPRQNGNVRISIIVGQRLEKEVIVFLNGNACVW